MRDTSISVFRKSTWWQCRGQVGKRARLETEEPVRKLSQWPRQEKRTRIARDRMIQNLRAIWEADLT